jgi:hypothetical protein
MTDLTIPENNIAQFVDHLAKEHNLVYVRTRLDDLAEKFSELSGDDIKPDLTEKKIIMLKKNGVIDGRQMTRILGRYLDEKKQHSDNSSDT